MNGGNSDEVENKIRGEGFLVYPPKPPLGDFEAVNADPNVTPAEMHLHFEGSSVLFEELKVYVKSEPNRDPNADPQDRCLVTHQFLQSDLPPWLTTMGTDRRRTQDLTGTNDTKLQTEHTTRCQSSSVARNDACTR